MTTQVDARYIAGLAEVNPHVRAALLAAIVEAYQAGSRDRPDFGIALRRVSADLPALDAGPCSAEHLPR